jgi:cob(I)alamin adenosyltransferase
VKIYTRTGDEGETTLFGGGRVPKSHLRVRAYGNVDELNAVVGRALLAVEVPSTRERLARVQHDLFALGAHLATPPAQEGRKRPELPPLPEARIGEMEGWMDEAEEALLPLKSFILPAGCPGAVELHLCRTVCRRAERTVVELLPTDPEVGFVVRYLNRLSDLCFVLARLENRRGGVTDEGWEKEGDEGTAAQAEAP